MSTNHHKTDPLTSYTRPRQSYGPAQITTATIRFEQRLRGVLRRINAAIKQGIVKDDIFGLREDTDTLEVDDAPLLRTEDNARKTVLFIRWLREQLNTELLEVVSRGENQYIRSAYAQGIRLATNQLQSEGLRPASADIAEILDAGNYQRGLRTLFTRTYNELDDLADDVVTDVRDELMQGFSRGEGPRKVARRIRGRIDSVGKHRATLIARTEMMNAHSVGYLDRVDDISEQTDTSVAVSHKWQTAEDDDVCPVCKPLNGVAFTTDEMRDSTFSLGGNEWQLRPPAHPQCRCTLVPAVGLSVDDLPPLEERLPNQPANS